MYLLGIETSCDETGVAIYHSERGLIAEALHSQIARHMPFGGVVPELASRDHVSFIVPLVKEVLKRADISLRVLSAIAYTKGPGLIGALLTGVSFAKSLAFALNIPAIPVHHLEAHVLAAMLEEPTLSYPFLALLVSGGHTQLIEVTGLGQYRIIGDTLDDAVGEAFDKTAKLLGLAYPGGSKLASLAEKSLTNPYTEFAPFPRPMLDKPGLSFSFSGLKTHARITYAKSKQDESAKIGIAKAFQEAVIEILIVKCQRALDEIGLNKLVIAGGVAANVSLRQEILNLMKRRSGKAFFPHPKLCTDNGAMIAFAGYLHFTEQPIAKKSWDSLAIEVLPRWPLKIAHLD